MVCACFLLMGALVPVVPLLYMLRQYTVALWFVIISMYWCIRIALCGGILASHVLVANSVARDKLGVAMGLVTFFMVGCRGISAVVCGSLYAWSITNVRRVDNLDALGFPFNEYFVFFLLALGALVMACLTFKLAPSMDSKIEN